jgi:hypothetical protein
LDLRFKSYGVLKISATLWAGYQPLSMQQFLPKTAQKQNFEIPPKIEILVFFKIKISIYRRRTRACFYCLDFQSKKFSYANFIVKKRPLYVNFSIPPCGI